MNNDRERIERDKRLIREMIDASWELAKKKGYMTLSHAVTAFHASINENESWRIQGITTSGSTRFDCPLFPWSPREQE
ncbi:MAG: hypothetical protein JW927_14685 [Deltaproteobacteria bacterium]|nr:hypothetical protein [Deltaproteobacteria bacterium]